jgi:hypothetical protein
MNFQKAPKKIVNWMFRSKIDLSTKWWHRLFKVLFVVIILTSAVFLIIFLSDSYNRIVHQWHYVESLSSRLASDSYSGRAVPLKDLYEENEVITDREQLSGTSFSLADKEYLQPYSPIFLEDIQQSKSFCSDKLYEHIDDIASTNNIKIFSTVEATPSRVYSDVDAFITYLENKFLFDTNCVMLDRFTRYNDDDTTTMISFIRPVDTSRYIIHSYRYSLDRFIFMTLSSIAFFLFCILCTILIYYKVILYIVYGKVEKSSLK